MILIKKINIIRVWKEDFKLVKDENGELKLHILFVTYLYFKIPLTIVFMSLIEKDNKFYLELGLNDCLYEI